MWCYFKHFPVLYIVNNTEQQRGNPYIFKGQHAASLYAEINT